MKRKLHSVTHCCALPREPRGHLGRALGAIALGLVAWAHAAPSAQAGASSSPLGTGRDRARVYQGRKSYYLDKLPADLGAAPLAAVERWGEWAVESGYRLELTADGRVLLLMKSRRTPRKELKLIEETLELFDELLPAPQRGEHGEPLPRLAEDAPLAALGSAVAPPWIQHGPEADTETIVLLAVDEQADYEAAIDLMVGTNQYLKSWAASGKRQLGFVLDQPLCGSLPIGKLEPEEYDFRNELVHRLTRLLVTRRFGRQPWWLTVGLAWTMELELRGTVYCFPGKDGFVSRGSHGAWPNNLRNLVRKKDSGISWQRLADWQRWTWNDGDATLAWGVTKYLSMAEAQALPMILEDFRALRNIHGIDRGADGRWRILTDYTVSSADQKELLEGHLGEEFAEEMGAALAKGKWPRRR